MRAIPGLGIRHGSTLFLAAIAVLGSAAFVFPLRARQQRRGGEIVVQTDLVDILASVTDANGQPIPDLTQDAFSLSEEGVPQKIERFEAQTNRPLDLALMVDSSMSAYKDMKFETDAAAHFIQQVVRPADTLGVFEFDESVTQLSDFSDKVPKLQDAVRHIHLGSGTSIYDAVVLGSNALRRRPEGRRRAIVLVTDGGETTSVSKFDDARRTAVDSGTLLYTIIVRPVKNENGRNTAGEHALITITDSTGGAMFILDDMSQIDEMFDRIDRELRTQYLLGYYPQPAPPPGSYRHVQLDVKGNYVVRYRKEYLTPGGPNE
ncbi:MAG TPA: VWA domain-containing protein [Candidatus Acidoferrales bacterium]|jgi:Ca-activated chloride channel family protein|nr:VWA domain-containing protein [Candidatus Acidoferrales bacterium]